MILRMIPIVALVSTLGLAACQEEGADSGETEAEAETGEMEETAPETESN